MSQVIHLISDSFMRLWFDESLSVTRMSFSMNACAGFVDLANSFRFNGMDTFVVNGMAVVLVAAMVSQLNLLRTACI